MKRSQGADASAIYTTSSKPCTGKCPTLTRLMPWTASLIASVKFRRSTNIWEVTRSNRKPVKCSTVWDSNPQSAKVVLLSLNPGHSEDDAKAHCDVDFWKAMMHNLRHEAQECPFYALNPKFAWTACGRWWRAHIRKLHETGPAGESVHLARMGTTFAASRTFAQRAPCAAAIRA